ncbi:MAG: hypothetical protein FWF98_04275, partial [Dehalococcoidia bacterium]|nr:hypothetical protein [Dehalococcoidia bacterium]
MEITVELAQKVEEAISNNRLVGNTAFSDSEYDVLLEEVRQFSIDCRNCKSGTLRTAAIDRLVFVTLVEIAKRWKKNDDDENDDKGFWQFVFKTIFDADLPEQKTQKTYESFRLVIDTLSRQKTILVANVTKKYWTTLMMHAFAPIKSIYAFLDLNYNIYRKDLGFNYTESDRGICELIAIRFCEILQSSVGNDKTVAIGTNTYAVKIGLRSLAQNPATQSDFVELLNKTLESINRLYYEQPFVAKSYYDGLISEWWQSKLAVVWNDRKTYNRGAQAVTKKNITAKFLREDDKVFLIIPPIRLSDAKSNVWLSVYVGSKYEQQMSEELFTKVGGTDQPPITIPVVMLVRPVLSPQAPEACNQANYVV